MTDIAEYTLPESLVDPTSGELVITTDVDALIDAFERTKKSLTDLYAFRDGLTIALCRLAPEDADTKTVRVRGDRRRVKLESPDNSYDQTILKEAFHAYPAFATEFLAIGSLRVRLREWNKALNETGPEDFEQFKRMIVKANRGPQGMPRITIEE